MKTKVKTKLSTKQKVMVGVTAAVLLFAVGGFFTALGKSQGFGFGYPIVKRVKTDVKTLIKTPTPYKTATLRLPERFRNMFR
ncbi:hypothetical protein KKC32_01745 [Patescibacteria group bacterium]|nr:hypothetical protein [Patescibacteria group bacterium]